MKRAREERECNLRSPLPPVDGKEEKGDNEGERERRKERDRQERNSASQRATKRDRETVNYNVSSR